MLFFIILIFLYLENFCLAQNNKILDLQAISGLDDIKEAEIKLTWTYNFENSLPFESTYYIYYSTFTEEINWLNTHKIIISTGDVNPNDTQSYNISLKNFLKDNNLAKDTTFYFVVQISSKDTPPSELSNVATGFVTLWPPKVEIIDTIQGIHEGEIILFFKGEDDYGYKEKTALSGLWYIQYSTDEFFIDYSTTYAQIVISTHSYESYQYPAIYNITGLESGTTYFFCLWAKDELENFSEISNKTTCWAQIDISPPQVITKINQSYGFKHVNLSWIFPYEDSYEDGFIYNTTHYLGSIEIRYHNQQPINTNELWHEATQVLYLTNILITPEKSTTTVISNLSNNTTYYFSIKIADEKFNWSSFSSTSPFSKPLNTPVRCINHDKHFSYDPVKNTTSTLISSTTVILDWKDAYWSAGISLNDNSNDLDFGDTFYYTIKIATYVIDNTLGNEIINESIKDILITSYTVKNLLEDTTYFWKLECFDSESSSSTSIFKFIINAVNSPPQFNQNPLISPTTIWHTKNYKIIFDWKDAYDTDPFDYILGYQIFISSYENFDYFITIPEINLLTTSYFIMSSSTQPTNLLLYENKKLYWYVKAYDSASGEIENKLSTTTHIGSFWLNQIDEPPKNFSIIQPTQAYILNELPLIFEWQTTADPDPQDGVWEYLIFISSYQEPILQFPIFNTTRELPPYEQFFSSWPISYTTSTFITNIQLEENSTYYFRIEARSGNFGIWDIKNTYSPEIQNNPSYFLVDLTSEAPKNYDILYPTSIINPSSLKGPLTFFWSPAFDPDPLDYTTYYFLILSSYNHLTYEDWFTENLHFKVTYWVEASSTFCIINLEDYSKDDMIPGSTYYWKVFSWGNKEWEKVQNPFLNPHILKPYGTSKSTGIFVISNQPPNTFETYTPSGSIKTYYPLFSWQQATDPDNYDPIISSYSLRISSSLNFDVEKTLEIFTQNNYYLLDTDFIEPHSTYYWYVTAYDKFGNYTNSSYKTFNISNFEPSQLDLLFPIKDEVVFSSTPVLKWLYPQDQDNDDLYFTIEISTDENFLIKKSTQNLYFGKLQYGTTIYLNYPFDETLTDNFRYFWRVIANDNFNGQIISTSSFFVDYISEPPNVFDIYITSGIVNNENLVFSWQPSSDPDPNDYVKYYILNISTQENTTIGISTYVIVFGSTTTSYHLNLKELTENAVYCWWVEAYDTKDKFTKSISSYLFIVDLTTQPLDDIELLTPGSFSDFVRVSSQEITFSWSGANKTEWWKPIIYKLNIDSSKQQNKQTIEFSLDPYNNYNEAQKVHFSTSSIFIENTTYYWWVEASNAKEKICSNTYYFFYDIINDPPENFILFTPSGPVQTKSPTFLWQQTTDPDDQVYKYLIKYSSYLDFSNFELKEILYPTTFFVLDNKLKMQNTYYWNVTAFDTRGSSTTSPTFQFYIPYLTPKIVDIIYPQNNEKISTRKPNIIWKNNGHMDKETSITHYKLQLSTISYDDNFIINTITSEASYKIVNPLIQNITFYLKISAIDEDNIEGPPQNINFFVLPQDIPKPVNITAFEIQQHNIQITWQQVTQYIDGTEGSDIAGYNIYRSTSLENIFNKIYEFLPSSVNQFTDQLSPTTYYYIIRTVTIGGIESPPHEEILSTYNLGSIILYLADSKLIINNNLYKTIKDNNYKIIISTLYVNNDESEKLNIIKKYKIEVVKNDISQNIDFYPPLTLEINLEELLNKSFGFRSKKISNIKPQLFMYNDVEYVYINTQYIENKIISKISKPAIYSIRLVETPTKPSIVNIYPKKIFTPFSNKDNKINFVVYNPTLYQPQGEIYDLNLRYVAKLKNENNILSWDGRYESGEFVPKGIYLYKIKIGEDIFTGSIIVAK